MKYFSEEELARELTPLSDLALEALAAGEVDRLLALLTRMSVGHIGLAKLGLQWIARMLGKIRTDMGEEVLDAVLEKSTASLMAPYARDFLAGNEKEVLSELVLMFRVQVGADVVPAGETDDEVAFSLAPCGSGGSLILDKWPETLPEIFPACSDGTPIYCHMCKALQRALNDACGATVWTSEINDTVPGACELRFSKQATKGQRLFETQELYQVAKPRCARAIEKVLEGDFGVADLIKDQHLEWRPWHDLFVQMATYILSAVYEKKGSEYLDGFLEETYDPPFGFIYAAYGILDDIDMFRMLVQTWHYHIATFRVVEEDDRFAFILDPCGSGGRLFRSEMNKGAFSYGEGGACLMGEPADINFNREGFPIYCTHCASSNRDQFEGKPFVFVIDGHVHKEPGAPCIQYLYKKAAKREVPPAMLTQVGKSAVEPL